MFRPIVQWTWDENIFAQCHLEHSWRCFPLPSGQSALADRTLFLAKTPAEIPDLVLILCQKSLVSELEKGRIQQDIRLTSALFAWKLSITFLCRRDCKGSTFTMSWGMTAEEPSTFPGPTETGPTPAKGVKPKAPSGLTHFRDPKSTCSQYSYFVLIQVREISLLVMHCYDRWN